VPLLPIFRDDITAPEDPLLHPQLKFIIKLLNRFFMSTKQVLGMLTMVLFFMQVKVIAQPALKHFNQPIVLSESDFKRITITGNIDVVLVSVNAEDAGVKVTEPVADKLKIRVTNEELFIEPRERLTDKERLTVYILADKLETLSLRGNSFVTSRGIVSFPDLRVFLDSDARIALKTNSCIQVTVPEDYQFREDYYYQVYTIVN